ncbi:MAG: CvpA family protein [Deltaproteobacteria bacterium]|nr:CvpA family protein [Deltaproteobacteria bacterium]
MNILDYIILGLMAFFVVKGIFRGFFREISSLAGIIFGIWIGNHYHPQMADLLKTYIPLEKSLSLISFLLYLECFCTIFLKNCSLPGLIEALALVLP